MANISHRRIERFEPALFHRTSYPRL